MKKNNIMQGFSNALINMYLLNTTSIKTSHPKKHVLLF